MAAVHEDGLLATALGTAAVAVTGGGVAAAAMLVPSLRRIETDRDGN